MAREDAARHRRFEGEEHVDWPSLRPRLLAIAHDVVRRRELAEDVVSGVIVTVLERQRDGLRIDDMQAYLSRAVRHRAIDVVRSGDGRAVAGSAASDDAIAAIVDDRLGHLVVDEADSLSPVREAFDALSEQHRRVLERTVIGGEPPRVVAEELGISPNAVSAAAVRARRALSAELRAVLQERAGGECAVHARSQSLAAMRHVRACAHCSDVRGGSGRGRWVFATLPILLGSSGALVGAPRASASPASSLRRTPALAAAGGLALAIVATVGIAVAAMTLPPAPSTEAVEAESPPGAAAAPSPTTTPLAPVATEPAADVADDATVAPAVVTVPVSQPVAAPTATEGPAAVPSESAPPALPNPTDPPTPTEPPTPTDPPDPTDPTDPSTALPTTWEYDDMGRPVAALVALAEIVPGELYELGIAGATATISPTGSGDACSRLRDGIDGCIFTTAAPTIRVDLVDLECGTPLQLQTRPRFGEEALVEQPLQAAACQAP